MILINPSEIKCFGAGQNMHFYLVTNSFLSNKINLVDTGQYLSYNKIIFDANNTSVKILKDDFTRILQEEILENAHVLVITPENYFRAPSAEHIGAKRKLVILPCNSTPTDLDSIAAFLEIIIRTDPLLQQKKSNEFFRLAAQSEYLEFVDHVNHTSAIFKHMNDVYIWNEQGGFLNYGEQQLAPAGEINVFNLPVQEFDENLRLDFNGTLAFHGYPIVHSGTPSFSLADQKRIFDQLTNIVDHPIIAEVKDGEIQRLTATSVEGEIACNMLQSMFNVDSRYRILLEIGFGINTKSKIIQGNHAMNETFGGTNGIAHFGLGIIPYTQYHIDILCMGLKVMTDKGELLIGNNKQTKRNSFTMKRRPSAGCLCIEGM